MKESIDINPVPNKTNSRETVLSCLPDAELLISAPGRVNLIGEHVDYNMGIVLPAAVNRRMWLAVRALPEPIMRISALNLDETAEIDLENLSKKVDKQGKPLPLWAMYPAAVAGAFQSKGYSVGGLEACIASNLPMRAGLSSSAALEVAFALAFQTLSKIEMNRMQLAQLCRQAEADFIGVQCGLMDQFAVSHGVARHALFFDTRSLEWQPIPMPPDTVIVVANSGMQRELAGSAYNQRKQECQKAVELLHQYDPAIHSLRDVSPAAFLKYEQILPPVIAKRARHVIEEIDRVQRAAVFLVNEDAAGFGRIMLDGHRSLRDLYEVSCEKLDFLVEEASKIPGCLGARLTGAGFGGCTVNLVEKTQAEQFCSLLKTACQKQYGSEMEIIICQADRGAYVEKIEKAAL